MQKKLLDLLPYFPVYLGLLNPSVIFLVYSFMVILLLTFFSLVIGHGNALWQHLTKFAAFHMQSAWLLYALLFLVLCLCLCTHCTKHSITVIFCPAK